MILKQKITIIDAGQGWIVIDKPEGISVHNDSGKDVISFVSQRLKENEELRRQTSCFDSNAIGPVHRLDRETSGVMIVGLNKKTLAWLSQQFAERAVKKEYIALVHGPFNLSTGTEFFWDYPLSPESSGRKNIGGGGKKMESITRVTLLEQVERYSLIACEPLTGRIHQIRRHAAMSGHPVLCDERYGSKRAASYLKTNGIFNRLGLHSRSLSLKIHENSPQKTFQSFFPESFFSLIRSGAEVKQGTGDV